MAGVVAVSEGMRLTEGGSPVFNNVTFTDGGSLKHSTITSQTAKAGGGQSGATALSADVCHFSVCATLSDSALLPSALVGMRRTVYNQGAANMNVFPAVGETINALAANTAIAVAAGKAMLFECAVAGKWFTLSGA